MSIPLIQEKALVDLAVQGDKAAFNSLMIKYQSRIHNIVSRYASNHSEILDISQEAFLKAYRGISDFRKDSSFYTWLYRIAVNTAKNNLNNKKMRFSDLDVNTVDIRKNNDILEISNFSTPEDILMKAEVEWVMHQAVEYLPEKLRIPFILFENEGHSYIEIAQIMHCPIGTVRSRLHRARKKLESHPHALRH